MKNRSYNECLKSGEERLEAAGIGEAKLDARLLMEYCFGIDRGFIFLHGDDEINDENALNMYEAAIEKRSRRIPLQHITGRAYFMDYEFFVNDKVLIPRQDTEILVEKAYSIARKRLEEQKNQGSKDDYKNVETLKIVDMCTGSACIAISLYRMLKNQGNYKIYATDISQDALEIAEKNAILNAAEISFVQSDLFENEEIKDFDIIVSNPPYIPRKEIEELEEEVRLHDPMLALDGGEDGLDFYRKIIEGACSNKKPFTICLEIGYNQADAVSEILKEFAYNNIEVVKDLAGLDRVVIAYR